LATPEESVEGGLVLVVPKAGSEVHEHFAHTFRLAEHVRRHMRTAVIVERLSGAAPAADPSVEVRIQRRSDKGFFLRACELVWLAAGLRRKGFRAYFVRTSQTAAVPLILATRLIGGRVMYWNCGKAPKNRLRSLGIRQGLRYEIPMRIAFRWADLVVTGTPSLAEHYSHTYGISPGRIAVLPNEIDLELFVTPSESQRRSAREALDVREHESLVLAVHRFSPVRKTLAYVPLVLEALIERHPHVRFVFAGGGPEEAAVRHAVTEASLTQRVQMLGPVPHERVWRLYAAADVFMMPSYTEGFPRVLLEAMATRVPVASTDVGGVREVLPSAYHSRLAHRDRPAELVRAVDELLSNPSAAGELAEAGCRWVRRFDAPAVAQRLVALASS
jgi:glycosyltransferase involved in cell wall biosynthesis